MIRGIFNAYRSAFTGLPRPVWMLCAAALVNRAGTMVLPFLSLYFTQELAMSALQAGQLLGIFGLGSMLGSYLGGWLSDRIGSVRVQQLSFLGSGFGFLILGQVTSFWGLGLAIGVTATIADSFRPALLASVTHFSPPEVRNRALALVRLAVNLGMAVGPAVGGLLAVRHYGWLFVGDALTCWAAGILLVVALGCPGDPATGQDRRPDDQPAAILRSPWRDLRFLGFLGLLAVLGIVFFQIWITFPIYMRDFYHFPEPLIGGLMAFNATLIVCFEMVLVKKLEGANPLRVAGIGAALVCLGLAILPLGPGLAVAIFSTMVWTLGEMLVLPMANVITANRADSASLGRYMGAYSLAFGMSFVLAPVIGTTIYDCLAPAALWYGIGLTGGGLLIAFFWLAKSDRAPQ